MSDGTRTHDRLDHNQELYQLSYAHRGARESSSGFVRVSDGIRTHDRLDHNQELYQLSYALHDRRERV